MKETVMLFSPSWLELVCALLAVIILLPLVPNDRIRFYSCYIFYVFGLSLISALLVPIFLLRPKDPINLVISASVMKHLTRLIGIEWDIRGGEILSKKEHGGSVIAMNHQSIFDALGMFQMWSMMGRATVIAKRELLWVFPFGQAAWLAGLVYINRSDPKSANMQIQQAAKKLFSQKIHFCVFPEGTRNKVRRTGLLPFKRGAFRVALGSQTPIIPVVFSPYYFIDSKNKLFHKGKVIISVLKPIETKGMTMKDMETLKERTYQAMSEEYVKLVAEIGRERLNKLNHSP